MKNCTLQGDRFVMDGYDRLPAFSSFLPGLAGVKGIPIWSFYTNRGQAINSFGIHNKDNAILEFSPANTAYEVTPRKGFRTFVRRDGEYFEPFCSYDPAAKRRMEIEKNAVSITEESHGLRFTVEYFVLPHENIGALVRRVTVENLGPDCRLELLDGLAQIIQYGLTNSMYKEMSNLFKSWADVKNLENLAPVYTMRASGDDSAEVSEIEGGYFYCAVCDGKLQPLVYDRSLVFDYDNSMAVPVIFMEQGLGELLGREQCFANKVPCAFIPFTRELKSGESFTFTAYAGFAPSIELLNSKTREFCREGYSQEKLAEARSLVGEFTGDVWTRTSDPLFDKYIEQCYLDNFLRGGYPFVFGEGEDKKVIHLFSRKHGDPERDYNFFSTAGEYYSQGNGNFRDVCQNRRNDVFFDPAVGDFNVKQFYNLVQMDGYNPLEIRPSTFVVRDREKAREILAEYAPGGADVLEKVLDRPFTPGGITNAIAAHGLEVNGGEEELVEALLAVSDQRQEAGFGEGYWSDHWDYDLDLVEDYLLVYPEDKGRLLFEDCTYKYYDSPAAVRPRRDTYVLSKNGPRQYGAVEMCKDKLSRPGFDEKGTNWLMDESGREVTASLFGKMLTLAVNKFALLDPCGLGVEMDGGKPGWNDAMNGLPGLFGSSMPETLELKRLVEFMLEAVREYKGDAIGVEICIELVELMDGLFAALHEGLSDFEYWDKAAGMREKFREKVKLSVTGEKVMLGFGRLEQVLAAFDEKLNHAVERAMELGDGIMPTYFTYEADNYEVVKDPGGTDRISPYGLPSVRVGSFKQSVLPYFLEGPARMLAAVKPGERDMAAEMCRKLKESEVYDRELKMYKTSAPLDGISMENGRIRAFTPGWLERESVFLHMEYKYLLGMLKAGLYEEFYTAMGDALIPYQDPETYGRSILENSSFIASSRNPDPAVHGQGFVGRLSGSTVEAVSMWLRMFLGEGGFFQEDGEVKLKLMPLLPGRMFDEKGEAAFTLCGSCRVTYHNDAHRDCFGPNGARVVRMTVRTAGGETAVDGGTLGQELALAVREGRAEAIDAWLE